MSFLYRLVDHTAPGWPEAVEALWERLTPEVGAALPVYFVKTAFVNLGGRLLSISAGDELRGVGLLFPRGVTGGRPSFTMRLHQLGALPEDVALGAAVAALLAPAEVLVYRPGDGRSYAASHAEHGGFDVGRPELAELPELRRLHRTIWGAAEGAQYPDDLHSAEFGLGTSLVARRADRLAGFLIGFRRFGGPPGLQALGLPYTSALGIESQVMGVVPEFRRFGLAATLKRAQARAALDEGLDLIHWTADPLQFANAVLNFGKLRAVAGEFHPAYYSFQNALNRVSASRLGITWLPASAHGRAGLEAAPQTSRDLARFAGVALLNDGLTPRHDSTGAPFVALEIPPDWTALQAADEALARRWRTMSDELLGAHLGFAPGRYLVVDAAAEGEQRYLVAQRFAPELLAP